MLNALASEAMGRAGLVAAPESRPSLEQAPGAAAPEPEHQSFGGLWPFFALAALLLVALGVVAVLRQRSRRRAEQDRVLLEGSMLSGFPPAVPAPASAAAEPPVSNRVASVLAEDRAARSGRPLSVPPSVPPGSLPPPPSERQWQSQRPPRSHKDPQ